MKQKWKQWMSILLSVLMVLGMMPGMSFTAHAKEANYAGDPYAALVPTNADSDADLAGKVVKFNGYDWYIIEDNSTAVNVGSVTLLAKNPITTLEFDKTNSSNQYEDSTVKAYLDGLTAEGGAFAGVTGVIMSVKLRDVYVTGAKLYLLSTEDARDLPENVRKCSNDWWLRSWGGSIYDEETGELLEIDAAEVYDNGFVNEGGYSVNTDNGVRPALQLDLSCVSFSSGTKTFKKAPVAKPEFSPAGGTYAEAQRVEISTKTTGATIYYTTDGTTPTTSSAKYTEAITVDETTMIKAIAVKDGLTNSAIASTTYTIANIYGAYLYQVVKFNGMEWYLIKDGSESKTSGSVTLLAKESISASKFNDSNNNYKTSTAKAYLDGLTTSGSFKAVAGAIKNVDLTDVGVTGAKLYLLSYSETATLPYAVRKCNNASNADIHYWWLRTKGTHTNNLCVASVCGYEDNIDLEGWNCSVKAGIRPALQLDLSAVSFSAETKTFTVKPVATPEFSLAAGSYIGGKNVGISTKTKDATIYYTTDGSTPTKYSKKYTGGIAVTENTTIKAIAVKDGLENSAVASATYTITPTAYTAYMNQKVKFGNNTWFVIGENQESETSGSLTLLSYYYHGSYQFNGTDNNTYEGSAIEAYLNNVVKRSYASVADAIKSVDLPIYKYGSTTEIKETIRGAKLYPLSVEEVKTLPEAVLNEYHQYWWLRSPGQADNMGMNVKQTEIIDDVSCTWGASMVLPALQMDLSAVDFDAETKTFTVKPAATPEFNLEAGSYVGGRNVGISTKTEGATIYYTTDGSNPTTSSKKYTGGIAVTENTTIKAIAVKDGLENSAVASATYTITPTPYTAYMNKEVHFGGYRWYVIEDNWENENSGSLTLFAASFYNSWRFSDSDNTFKGSDIENYINNLTKKVFGSVAGVIKSVDLPIYKYGSTTEVKEIIKDAKLYLLSVEEVNALPEELTKNYVNHWWLRSPGCADDRGMVVSKTQIFNDAPLYQTFMIRPALQLDLSAVDFDAGTKTFTVKPVATPKFSPEEGGYTGDQVVKISTDTDGATIYYTTNGTTPTESSTKYSEPITIRGNTTIKAIAVIDGKPDSEVASATYTIKTPDPISYDVTFKVVNGSWNDGTTADKKVTLSGVEGDTLKLSAAQIPAVGSKPKATFKAGSWNVTPSTSTEITANTTYTYTYAKKAAITPVVTIKGWTYGETAKVPSVSGNTGNGAVTYTYAVKGSDSYKTAVPTDAGEYTVKATIAETAQYLAGTATANFTISKKAASVKAQNKSKKAGESDPTLTATVTGTVGTDRLNYTLSRTAGEAAGKYTIKVTLGTNKNYNVTTENAEFTIIAVVTPTATPTTKPTTAPTTKPTTKPTATPKATTKPTTAPTAKPTTKPTATPKATAKPTTKPTATPKATTKPTTAPTVKPTTKPTATPKATTKPTTAPTATPKATTKPTTAPTAKPTTKPCASPAASTKPVTEVFTDVKPSAWFVKAVQYVYDHGIMTGKGETFQPNTPVTREEFAQTLYNHMGKPDVNTAADNNPFPDVKANGWYFKAVIWAKDNDIVKGYANGKFGVGDKITREQLAQMLYKYAKLRGYDMTTTNKASEGYLDSNKRSDWAYTALDWAVSQGIISGKGSTGAPKSEMKLDPKGNATRAECAQMVMKLLQKNGL